MADRSRRRCVLRKHAVPDATHYVGYVEDDETPEMIMKKFEELERIKAASRRPARAQGSAAGQLAAAEPGSAAGSEQRGADSDAAAGASGGAGAACSAHGAAQHEQQQQEQKEQEEDGPLNHEQLHAIFKATSLYNVKSLLGNNEALMVEAARSGSLPDMRAVAWDSGANSGSDDDLEELRGFWSDDEWSRPRDRKQRGSKRPRGEGSKAGGRGGGRAGGLQRNARNCFINQYNRDSHAFIRRRMKAVDPDAILQLRLPPPPLPLSWGRAVRPFRPTPVQQVAGGSGGPAAQAAAAAAGAAAPRGLIHQPLPLPASRNCDPGASTSGSGNEAGSSGSSGAAGCQVHMSASVATFDFSSLHVQDFQAVLINTGWEARPQQQQQQQQQQQEQQEQAGPGPGSEAAAAAAAAGVAAPGVPSWACPAPGEADSHRSSGSSRAAGSSSTQPLAAGLPPVVSRLAAMPIPSLCPRGFLFIWANKEHLQAVVKLMSAWGFSYVENLTWVLLAPNHSIMRLPCTTIQRSHITLYIFRKEGEGRDIELRHQRNPDVVFDCVRAVEGREWDVPADVFDTIETLLPTGTGRFLELWAPRHAGRAGWTHVGEGAAAAP